MEKIPSKTRLAGVLAKPKTAPVPVIKALSGRGFLKKGEKMLRRARTPFAFLLTTECRTRPSLVEGSISLQSTADPHPRLVEEFNDRELIKITLAGDQRGFERLTRRYQDRLFTSVLHEVGCPVIAEDIVQDTFVRAYLNLGNFRKESNFYTWLYRIAINARRTYYHRGRRMKSLDSLGNESERISTANRDSPSRSLERTEECRQVRQALKRMDEHYRVVLVLREFDGFDYQTIAEILELKVGTVRSRLSRAREQLRQELAAYLEGNQTPPIEINARVARVVDSSA